MTALALPELPRKVIGPGFNAMISGLASSGGTYSVADSEQLARVNVEHIGGLRVVYQDIGRFGTHHRVDLVVTFGVAGGNRRVVRLTPVNRTMLAPAA